MSTKYDSYFAAKEADETVEVLMRKSHQWFQRMDVSGYLDKLRNSWTSYHGAYYQDSGESHQISFGGEQGELTQIGINHYRNIAQHILNMITSTRPSMQARAINTDQKSTVQTTLANGLLDYYMRDHRLEEFIKVAAEYAIVFGSGYIKMEWNSTRGEVYDFNEELGVEIREGDLEFTNLSPFDVLFDSSREDRKHDWVITRSFKNRFDIAAKYPELKDKILALPTKSDLLEYTGFAFSYDDTDLIPVYEFYHRRSESMPDGRYMLYLDAKCVLMDSPMPYRNLPVYCIAPSYYLGTPYAYTPMFDLLGVQDAVNSLYSTILSNQTAFGVQNIVVPKSADVSIAQLSGGLNVIEANEKDGAIRPLNLTNTPKEIFEFLQMLEKAMETVSGVNAVSRGNPDPNLRSGNALALVQSMTLQFLSGLQQSYVMLIEDLGTGIINILKDHATVPRIATIVGKNKRTYLKEFTGDQLDAVNRVVVDIGNPLAKCLAKDTEVLMFDGTKRKVQDINIGEKIMGPDSLPRTVSAINSGTEMMYEVISKDTHRGIKYGCNESHILTLRYCSNDERYGAKKGDILDISIRDYLKLSDRQKNILQGYKVGVEFDKKDLIIPPYILGTWLGDGTSATTAITTMDTEIFGEWFEYSQSIGMNMRLSTSQSSGKAKTYHLTSGESNGKSDRNPMMNELRAMELINNKHIPQIYLTSNRIDRLELLAGLIDTDGSKMKNCDTYVITQKSDKLSENIIFLAESLGFRVTYKKVKTEGFDIISEVNKITIGGNTWEIPCRLPRKQSTPKQKTRNWNNYGINVTPVGEGTYYGFTLKEEPHFVLGDFTVTHNTTAGRVEMAEQMLQMGLLKTPEQYISVIETGNLDNMTEDTFSQLNLVRGENERLTENSPVIAVFTDEHLLHIKEHAAVLADPDLRLDPDLVTRVTAHINEHITLLRSTDPDLLTILGQQPLGPQGGSPAGQQTQMPPDASMQGAPQETMGGPAVNQQLAPADMMQQANLPQPAQIDPSLLPNPELQAAALGNVKGM